MLDLLCIELALLRAACADWDRACVRFLIVLFAVWTARLTQLACAFPGAAQTSSMYDRLQRFLRGFELDVGATARFVASFVGVAAVDSPWGLALDLTNWESGKAELNLLALVHGRVAFPLF